tara:strand:- start:773 stop:1006 length:234 start_codon:yes stop_codon:yes gene_type:complete
MDIRPRGFSAEDIPIDALSKYAHMCTVPNSEYHSKDKAIKDLNKLGFEVHTNEIIIKDCEHHGSYYEIYIKTSIEGF